MRATLFLLKRYLFPHKGSLLTLALWICVAGVALGITQLMVVLSVMTGFQKFLQKSYTQITSDLVVIPRHQQSFNEAFRASISTIPGIAAVTPFALGQGMIISKGVGGVVLEGVDLKTAAEVTQWDKIWVEPPLFKDQEKNSYWIWLGAQLAKKLQVKQGDTVNVFLADAKEKKILPFIVTAITKFGIYEHDLHYARIDLKVLDEIYKRYQVEPMYKCRLEDGANLDATAKRVKQKVGHGSSVKLWSEINQNLFLAVQHQKKLLFLVLEIIIALAAINVVNLLMMSSHQRRRDVAILRAMGMRLWNVFFFFVAQGAAVGASGIIAGIGLGYVACKGIERFQPAILSESVYNVRRLPIQIELTDVAMICGVAFVLCIVFSVLPAIRAALSRPVEALRYE